MLKMSLIIQFVFRVHTIACTVVLPSIVIYAHQVLILWVVSVCLARSLTVLTVPTTLIVEFATRGSSSQNHTPSASPACPIAPSASRLTAVKYARTASRWLPTTLPASRAPAIASSARTSRASSVPGGSSEPTVAPACAYSVPPAA